VHNTVNILDKVPLSVQAANRGIRAKSIWRRIGRPPAAAIDVFANNTAPDADGQTNDRRNRRLTMKKNASLSHPSIRS